MTATSLVAATQSSRESRFPVITSMSAALRAERTIASILAGSPVGRAKHRRLRKPRFTRHSTTRLPMNPAAPVTRIGSSGLMTDCAVSIALSLLGASRSAFGPLFSDIGLFDGIDAQKRKEPARMIAELDHILHERVLPQQQQKR